MPQSIGGIFATWFLKKKSSLSLDFGGHVGGGGSLFLSYRPPSKTNLHHRNLQVSGGTVGSQSKQTSPTSWGKTDNIELTHTNNHG